MKSEDGLLTSSQGKALKMAKGKNKGPQMSKGSIEKDMAKSKTGAKDVQKEMGRIGKAGSVGGKIGGMLGGPLGRAVGREIGQAFGRRGKYSKGGSVSKSKQK
jgi:hypothetical protein